MSEQAQAADETVVAEVTEDAAVEVDTEATATEETTEGDEGTQEVEASESSTESETTEKKDSVQKRIDELTSDIYELRRDRDYWRNLNEKPVEVKPEPIATKTLADFDYDEGKYAEHVAAQAEARARQAFEAETAQQAHARKEAEFRGREAKFATKHSDYYAVTNTPGLEISPALADSIMDSDIGAELAYHLGQNLNVASKLSRMPYREMLKEVVKIETNLSTKKPVVTSKKPPPAPKIEAVDAQVDDGPGTTQKSFEKWRAKYRK
jgi:hypothetical protein